MDEIDLQIQAKHLLKHEFYLVWSRGELSLDCLLEYALEYYHHVKAFPTYLSALHARSEDPTIRKTLLKNLMEEEAGVPNHPDLWRRFALALGATEAQLNSHRPNAEISHLIQTFREICSQGTIVEGVAALYAYESQIPEICVSKIEGLRKHYSMTDPQTWEYFHVHIHADEVHAAEEKALIAAHAKAADDEGIQMVVSRILDALWSFLTGLCQKYGIRSSCRC